MESQKIRFGMIHLKKGWIAKVDSAYDDQRVWRVLPGGEGMSGLEPYATHRLSDVLEIINDVDTEDRTLDKARGHRLPEVEYVMSPYSPIAFIDTYGSPIPGGDQVVVNRQVKLVKITEGGPTATYTLEDFPD